MLGEISIELISSLNFSENNPNEGDVGAISESIEEFGFLDCVEAYDPDGARLVKAGHHRILAALEQGIDEVPVFWLSITDPVEADAYMLGNNQIGSHSKWDMGKLSGVVAQFTTFEGTGFSNREQLLAFADKSTGFGSGTITISVGDFDFTVSAREWVEWETQLREQTAQEATDAASVLKERLGLY